MVKEIKAFIKASHQTAFGLLTISFVMFILLLFSKLLNFIGLKFVIESTALFLAITILATFGVALYIYNINRENKKEDELKRQIDLLGSLYVELEAISNEKKEIKFEEGNLQWFKDALGYGKPLHSVWSVNPSPYLSYLHSNINGKETSSLKKKLVKLNQKIEMINNIVLSGEYNLGIFGKKTTRDEVMLNFVRKTITEMIGLTEEIKKIIKKIINP